MNLLSLVHKCISRSQLAILINGSPSQEFRVQNGLPQGLKGGLKGGSIFS